MTRAASIDKKIVTYLNQLDVDQKKTVLSVAKALADASNETDIWEDDGFATEMERRNSELDADITKGYTWVEVKAETRSGTGYLSYKEESKEKI